MNDGAIGKVWWTQPKRVDNHQLWSNLSIPINNYWWEDLQDGRRVRRGDHLPPHRYIRNTSTCGTTPTEHLLNAGRRLQTSQKTRNSPRTWVGQKKKENFVYLLKEPAFSFIDLCYCFLHFFFIYF